MSAEKTIQKIELAAILQKHYRRFIVSAEFVTLLSGEIALRITFADGRMEYSRGKQYENYTNIPLPSGILLRATSHTSDGHIAARVRVPPRET